MGFIWIMAFIQINLGDGDPDLEAFDLDHALAWNRSRLGGFQSNLSLDVEVSRSTSLDLEVSR